MVRFGFLRERHRPAGSRADGERPSIATLRRVRGTLVGEDEAPAEPKESGKRVDRRRSYRREGGPDDFRLSGSFALPMRLGRSLALSFEVARTLAFPVRSPIGFSGPCPKRHSFATASCPTLTALQGRV